MDMDSMTIGDFRELRELISGGGDEGKSWFVPGKKVLIRTVTHYQTGEVVSVSDSEVTLKDAAWAADTDRFAAALETGELSEVEPFPDGEIMVSRGSIVDAAVWAHPLPRETK